MRRSGTAWRRPPATAAYAAALASSGAVNPLLAPSSDRRSTWCAQCSHVGVPMEGRTPTESEVPCCMRACRKGGALVARKLLRATLELLVYCSSYTSHALLFGRLFNGCEVDRNGLSRLQEVLELTAPWHIKYRSERERGADAIPVAAAGAACAAGQGRWGGRASGTTRRSAPPVWASAL